MNVSRDCEISFTSLARRTISAADDPVSAAVTMLAGRSKQALRWHLHGSARFQHLTGTLRSRRDVAWHRPCTIVFARSCYPRHGRWRLGFRLHLICFIPSTISVFSRRRQRPPSKFNRLARNLPQDCRLSKYCTCHTIS